MVAPERNCNPHVTTGEQRKNFGARRKKRNRKFGTSKRSNKQSRDDEPEPSVNGRNRQLLDEPREGNLWFVHLEIVDLQPDAEEELHHDKAWSNGSESDHELE
uniref:Uncharacterized protein n=1 Tax=Anopheles maculatus TaxID=74869 RepID=A0A182T1H7_9DIPT